MNLTPNDCTVIAAFILAAAGISIAWSDDLRYWRILRRFLRKCRHEMIKMAREYRDNWLDHQW